MNADLRPSNLGTAKLTGATLLREFLEHRVAPLQEHSLPLWRLGEADAALRLSSEALTDENLVAALNSLVGGDVAKSVGAPVPLFLHDDWEKVVNAMPTFNGEGLVPAEAPEDLAALAMVNVSSDDSSGSEEEEEEEEEELDSEATGEESGESFPRHRSRALRSMPDDNEAGARRSRGGLSLDPEEGQVGAGSPRVCSDP